MKTTTHNNGAWTIALALLLLPLLAGCGGGDGGRTEDRTIRVTRNIGGREGFRIHFETWKAAFERAHPGWKMELIDLGNVSGAEYYKTRIATGDMPDIAMTWTMPRMLVDAGQLLPLEKEFYDKFGIVPPEPYKGCYYTSQAGMQVQAIAVNKKMWADAGITEPPKTWDEFLDGLQKVKDRGYVPLVYGGKDWSAFMPLLLSLNANLYHDAPTPDRPSFNVRRDRGEARFATDPTARLVLQKTAELLERFAPKGAGSDGYNESQRDFYSGKGATWMMGCWMAGDLEPQKVEFEIDYWPIPSMTGQSPVFYHSSAVPNGWAITTTPKGEKLAKARAALDLFFDPVVYQAFVNGEAQMGIAAKVDAKTPKYAWPAAQKFVDNMAARVAQYGTTPGEAIALDDMPPLNYHVTLRAVSQELLIGNRDYDTLLKLLDDEWDQGRKEDRK
jgi:ABC-type glycerol-3-phosphate transport system substrate-binding protein